MAEQSPGAITLEQAAKLLMVTPQWVMKLRRDGWISSPYTVVGVVQGYIKYLKDEERRTSKTAANSEARDLRAEEIKLRIVEKENALVRHAREEVVAFIDVYLGPLKADLFSIPARVTKDIPLRRKLESEINGAFTAAHRRLTAEAARVAEDGEAPRGSANPAAGRVGRGKQGLSPKRGRARAA